MINRMQRLYTLQAISKLWKQRGAKTSISYAEVIYEVADTGSDIGRPELTALLGTISSCVQRQGENITVVNVERLDEKVEQGKRND